jgi:hypothetical protein
MYDRCRDNMESRYGKITSRRELLRALEERWPGCCPCNNFDMPTVARHAAIHGRHAAGPSRDYDYSGGDEDGNQLDRGFDVDAEINYASTNPWTPPTCCYKGAVCHIADCWCSQVPELPPDFEVKNFVPDTPNLDPWFRAQRDKTISRSRIQKDLRILEKCTHWYRLGSPAPSANQPSEDAATTSDAKIVNFDRNALLWISLCLNVGVVVWMLAGKDYALSGVRPTNGGRGLDL